MIKIWLCALLFLNLLPGVTAQQMFPKIILPAQPGVRVTGSPLLFSDWVKAKVISHSPFFDNDSSLLFNFDLSRQLLLATVDQKTEIQISRKEFQEVTFYYGDVTFTFEHVPAINGRDLFCEIVKKEDKYSLYAQIHSEIRGNSYTESTVYYLVFPFPDVHSVRLKAVDMRLIRQAFGLNPDRQKVDAYFSQHASEELNGYFLKKLVEYLDE